MSLGYITQGEMEKIDIYTRGVTEYLRGLIWLPYPMESLLWVQSRRTLERCLVSAFCFLLFVSSQIATPVKNSLAPEVVGQEEYVLFRNIQGVFVPIDFDKINGMKLESFMGKMQQQLPSSLRSEFQNYAPIAFEMAQKYKVDPFWVIAVMWVESHFDIHATSSVGAKGLMQVMPKTGAYLARKLEAKSYGPYREREHEEFSRPNTNIEMGVFYLSYLVDKFSYHRDKHVLATIAYNVGPGRLKYLISSRRGRRARRIKRENLYLKKVRLAYFSLLEPFQSHPYGRTTSSTQIGQSKNPPIIF